MGEGGTSDTLAPFLQTRASKKQLRRKMLLQLDAGALQLACPRRLAAERGQNVFTSCGNKNVFLFGIKSRTVLLTAQLAQKRKARMLCGRPGLRGNGLISTFLFSLCTQSRFRTVSSGYVIESEIALIRKKTNLPLYLLLDKLRPGLRKFK